MSSANGWRNLSESQKRRKRDRSNRYHANRNSHGKGMRAARLTLVSMIWLSRLTGRRFFARLRDINSWGIGRSHIAFVHDVAMAVVAFVVALSLKFGLEFVNNPGVLGRPAVGPSGSLPV